MIDFQPLQIFFAFVTVAVCSEAHMTSKLICVLKQFFIFAGIGLQTVNSLRKYLGS